jgi:lipopolysaccharide transport system ATP-binding protein
MRPIINIEKLGKRYQLGERTGYRTIREEMIRTASALFRLRSGRAQDCGEGDAGGEREHVWALRDLNLSVFPGEVVGVIGRNGAGKSTLLKLLSRVTEPTAGRIELGGRVGSLLEVGTGFHPELTGRENIFLNGAILGMRRAEIQRKFDEIVAFAEVEKFLETPVKRYSSGMYVRLAFAVAAHLEPEILLVDEVLAVGDVRFQRRCLGRIGEIAHEGRTILFVSHNLASIESLCSTCLLFANGRLRAKGKPSEIIERYLVSEVSPGTGEKSLLDHPGRTRNSSRLMNSVALYSDSLVPRATLRIDRPLSVCVSFSSAAPLRPTFGITIKTVHGLPVFAVSNRWTNEGVDWKELTDGSISCNFESLELMPGKYTLDLHLGDFGDITRDLDVIRDAISFEVIPADVFGTGQLHSSTLGPVFKRASWTVTPA